MKSTHLYLLSAIFVVLLVFILLVEGPFKPEHRQRLEPESLIQDYAPANVVRVEISRKEKIKEEVSEQQTDQAVPRCDEKKVVFDKSSGRWLVSTSQDYPGDEKKITEALDKLKALQNAEIISTNPDSHPDMEVDEEKGTLLKLFGPNNSLIAELIIGKAGPTWGTSYVRRRNANNTVLVREGLHNTFTADGSDWLHKEIMKFELKDLSKVTVKSKDGEYTIEQPEENKWKITSPAELPCDQDVASSIGRTLSNLSLADVAPSKDLTQYGLDAPTYSITVEVKDTSPKTIHVGKITEKGEEYYARRDDSDFVILLRKYAVESIAKKLEDILDKSVLEFEPDELTQLTFSVAGKEILLKRDEEQHWVMESPFSSPADSSTMDYVVKTLSNLSAASVMASADPAETGLDAAATSVSLSFKDETKNRKLLVGNLKDEADYYVSIEGRPVIYRVSRHFIDGVCKKSHIDFASREITKFDVNDVTGLTIWCQGETLTLRKEDASWKFMSSKAPSEGGSPHQGEVESTPQEEVETVPQEAGEPPARTEGEAAPQEEAQPALQEGGELAPQAEGEPGPEAEGGSVVQEEGDPGPAEGDEPAPLPGDEPQVNVDAVNRLLGVVSNLRASVLVETLDPVECGFDLPSLELVVELASTKTIKLTMGKKRDDGLWFLKRDDRGVTYLIPDATAQEMLIPLTDFVRKPVPEEALPPQELPAEEQPAEETQQPPSREEAEPLPQDFPTEEQPIEEGQQPAPQEMGEAPSQGLPAEEQPPEEIQQPDSQNESGEAIPAE